MQEEVAYIAYHFHWALSDILDLEHPSRAQYVNQIAQINQRIIDGR